MHFEDRRAPDNELTATQQQKTISEQLNIKVLILPINMGHTKAILLTTDILSKSSTNQ